MLERLPGHSIITLLGLLYQFNQARDLRFRAGFDYALELIFRHIIFQILHHIKVLPPAIQNFKAGLLFVTTDLAVMERYGVTQSGATPHQMFSGF
jgi:hypothetical protein